MHVGAVMFFTEYSMQPVELGRELEERGFESLWVPEHSHVPVSRSTPFPSGGDMPRPYYDIYDPFVALTAAAAATRTLKLGTGVCLVNQRDPIQTAKLVASIDQISSGRFLFGVGNGWNREEMENHGTVFATRHKLSRERVEAMHAIWTQDQAAYHGEFVNFDPMMAWPKPVQKPYPAVIVGGRFPQAARRAIRYGNGWIPRTDYIAELTQAVTQFRQLAKAAGRDPATLPITLFRVPEDPDYLRGCRELGVSRVVFGLPAAKADELRPIMDRWNALQRQLDL